MIHTTIWKDHTILGNKLMQARKNKKLSQKELATRLALYDIRISSGAVSKWEKGDALPNAVQLFALCYILEITDPLNYFTGSVPEAADYSPALNSQGLSMLRTFKELLISSGKYAPKIPRRTTAMAELIEMREMRISTNRASAGTGNFLDDDQFEVMQFPVSQIPKGAEFGLRIVGDSMTPYYSDDQIVWVERCHELNPGEVGIFFYDGQGYIKQYREVMPTPEEQDNYLYQGILHPKITLFSFNQNYAPICVNPELGFEIIGRVLN